MVNLEDNEVGGSVDSKGVSISARFDKHAALLITIGICQLVYAWWIYVRTSASIKTI